MTLTDTAAVETRSYMPRFTIDTMSNMALLMKETGDTRTDEEVKQETLVEFTAIAAWHGVLAEATETGLTRHDWMNYKVIYWEEAGPLRRSTFI